MNHERTQLCFTDLCGKAERKGPLQFMLYLLHVCAIFTRAVQQYLLVAEKKALDIQIYLSGISCLQALKAPEHEHGKRCVSC